MIYQLLIFHFFLFLSDGQTLLSFYMHINSKPISGESYHVYSRCLGGRLHVPLPNGLHRALVQEHHGRRVHGRVGGLWQSYAERSAEHQAVATPSMGAPRF